MNRQTQLRKMKRASMKEKGNTFSQRVREAAARGTRVQNVEFVLKNRIPGL